LKEYRPGTFDRRVAYGQRERKLALVSSGAIDGFKVACRSKRRARDLAYSFRIRSRRIEKSERARYGLRIVVKGNVVYVARRAKTRDRRS